jgi:transcriptional regulator with XRE-family HTH domain
MSKSVFTDAYASVVDLLIALRKEKGVSQVELARRIGKPQQFVSLVERRERRVDVVEFFVIVTALGGDPTGAFACLAAQFPRDIRI